MLTENLLSEFLKEIRKDLQRVGWHLCWMGSEGKKWQKSPHQFQTGQVAFTGVDLLSWSICRSLGLEALTQGKTEHVQVSSKLQTSDPCTLTMNFISAALPVLYQDRLHGGL